VLGFAGGLRGGLYPGLTRGEGRFGIVLISLTCLVQAGLVLG
jgi:hypothetical protein